VFLAHKNPGPSDEEESATQAFVWESMGSYKGQREHFTGSVGPQGGVVEIVDIFELVFDK
jgi:hypothetical protein